MKRICLLALFLLTASPLPADRSVSVTVYNQDLALVRDVRPMELRQGTGEIRFTEVAARIDPTSVHFKSLSAPDKVAILEQNFEYDLVGADKILSKYLDQPIQVFTTEGKLFDGKLLAGAPDLVLEKKDGQIQVLSRAAVQNMDFPKLPQGLITRPTLVWLLAADKGGMQDMEVSYLTQGLSWHAEYVGVLDKDDKKLEVSAWVSVDNQSGTSYENARIKLMAGDPHRVQAPPRFEAMALRAGQAFDKAAQQFEEKAFFEYHIYNLLRPSTLKDNQTKQLSLFPSATVGVKKIYKYEAAKNPKKVQTTVEWINSRQENMGMPLPAGKFRLYKQDPDKSQQFIGEDQIGHTPKDEKVRLYVGDAFDLVAERKQKETRQLSQRSRQDTIEIKFRNHKDGAVEILAIEQLWGDWEIGKSTHKHEKTDAHKAEFKIAVPKDGEAVLEYTAVTRW